MNNLCKGCRITRTDFEMDFAQCNHEGAVEHCLPEYKIPQRDKEGHDDPIHGKQEGGGNEKQ